MYQAGTNPWKDVDFRVFTRMLRKDRRTDGNVSVSLRNFVGEGIKKQGQRKGWRIPSPQNLTR